MDHGEHVPGSQWGAALSYLCRRVRTAPLPCSGKGGLMDLSVDIYADTAYLTEMAAWATEPRIRGFTVNPTLLRQAGVTAYISWAMKALELVPELPLSLPMLAPDLAHMEIQAQTIASWGRNVYVKVPIQTSAGESTLPLIEHLSQSGIPLNVTAVFTITQVKAVRNAVRGGAPCIVSVFAGRVADTGKDPMRLMQHAGLIKHRYPNVRLLWASARQLWDVVQATRAGCDIITLPPTLLLKLGTLGKGLDEYSRETVAQFEEDARELRW